MDRMDRLPTEFGCFMNRYKASILHFICSAVFIGLIFILVRWCWYPGPLFEVANGIELLTILVAVDIILGPLITLVIFNPTKASLKYDMAFVVLVQLGFMLYGVWALFSARPVYLALVSNSFYVVTANEIDYANQERVTDSRFQSLPVSGPQYVGTRIPTDPKVVRDILLASRSGLGLQHLPEYYIPLKDARPGITHVGKPAQYLLKHSGKAPKEEIEKLLAYEAEKRKQGKEVLFIPVLNTKRITTIAIDRVAGTVLDIL